MCPNPFSQPGSQFEPITGRRKHRKTTVNHCGVVFDKIRKCRLQVHGEGQRSQTKWLPTRNFLSSPRSRLKVHTGNENNERPRLRLLHYFYAMHHHVNQLLCYVGFLINFNALVNDSTAINFFMDFPLFETSKQTKCTVRKLNKYFYV